MTGSGKSTTLNALLNNDYLIKDEENGNYKVKDEKYLEGPNGK